MNVRILSAASVITGLLLSPAVAAPIPDEVLLSIRGIVQTKPHVGFTHREHGKNIADCRRCHHRDTGIVGQKCSGCHGSTVETTNVCLRQAYHKQCLGCHSKAKKGPTKCNECHTGKFPSLAKAER